MTTAFVPICSEDATYTPYLDRMWAPPSVFSHLVCLTVLVAVAVVAAIATLMYVSSSPFSSLIVSPPSFCPYVLPCFTSPLPRSRRRLITLVLVFPLSSIPHPPHAAIFSYRLGVLDHILFVYYILIPFCTMYPFPLIKKQCAYRRNLPVTRFHKTVICSCLGTISES